MKSHTHTFYLSFYQFLAHSSPDLHYFSLSPIFLPPSSYHLSRLPPSYLSLSLFLRDLSLLSFPCQSSILLSPRFATQWCFFCCCREVHRTRNDLCAKKEKKKKFYLPSRFFANIVSSVSDITSVRSLGHRNERTLDLFRSVVVAVKIRNQILPRWLMASKCSKIAIDYKAQIIYKLLTKFQSSWMLNKKWDPEQS